ncbi:MAG: hypothetical protein JRC77_02445 [Deltaproteobacteria bacterium]|nr:hypothetical protein [Deltaproteobacteria bacterium]
MRRHVNRALAVAVVCLLSVGVSACGKYGKPVRSDTAAMEQPFDQPTPQTLDT